MGAHHRGEAIARQTAMRFNSWRGSLGISLFNQQPKHRRNSFGCQVPGNSNSTAVPLPECPLAGVSVAVSVAVGVGVSVGVAVGVLDGVLVGVSVGVGVAVSVAVGVGVDAGGPRRAQKRH